MNPLFEIGIFLVLWMILLSGCNGQSDPQSANDKNKTANKKPVGGGCDGCELMFVDMPATINSVDTSSGWTEKGQKLLIKGAVIKNDGLTPAGNVIIYYWQTDSSGYYTPKEGMTEKAKRHGHIRGWVKTNSYGEYSIYTIRPAPYPQDDMPAHIHLSIKEPGIANEYYIDDLVFDDDRLLTSSKRKILENRGGSGILKTSMEGDLQIAIKNIVLGLNIPDYPTQQ